MHSLRLSRLPLLLILLTAAVGTARATPYDNKPKILLHLTYPTTKGDLCQLGQLSDCRDAAVNGDVEVSPSGYFVYLIVAKGNAVDIAGLQLSIDYNPAPHAGVDIYGWGMCADAQWDYAGVNGQWPASGSNNL